jgi:hypothetical protein
MQDETQVTKPETSMQYIRGHNAGHRAGVESVLQQLIEICADYYHGYDLAGDAIHIAKLVICTGKKDEDTAAMILNNMGYMLSLMVCWEGLKPETTVKLSQIHNLVFPDNIMEVDDDLLKILK